MSPWRPTRVVFMLGRFVVRPVTIRAIRWLPQTVFICPVTGVRIFGQGHNGFYGPGIGSFLVPLQRALDRQR